MNTAETAKAETAQTYLQGLLLGRIDPKGNEWLDQQLQQLRAEFKQPKLFMAFAGAPRFVGKDVLQLTPDEISAADGLSRGFNPQGWRADAIARAALLLAIPAEEAGQFKLLKTLQGMASVDELVAIYQTFPLLPFPKSLTSLMEEGIRTNMTSVFDAIALDNPYPAYHLEENAWNQLYLKSAFMDRPIHRIYDVEGRANASLARIISDYAHERWSAGRVVSPEFWRPVSGFLDETLLEDIKKILESNDELQQWAAVLVCLKSDSTNAKKLINNHQSLVKAIIDGQISWSTLGAKWWEQKAQ